MPPTSERPATSSAPPRPTSTAGPRTTSTPPPRTTTTTTTTPRTTTTSTTPRTTSTTPTTSRTTSTTSTAPRTTSTTSTAPRTTSTTSRTTSTTSKTTSTTSHRHSSTTTYPPPPPHTYQPPPPQPGNTSPWEPPVVTVTATPPPQNVQSPEPTLSTTSTSIYTTEWVSTSPDGVLYTTTIRATIVIVPSPTPSSSSSSHGALIGGIAGGVVGLIFILIGFLFWFRNRRRGAPGVNSDRGTSAQYEDHLSTAGAEITQFRYDPGVRGSMSMSGGTMSAGPHSPTFSGSGMQQDRDSQALLGGYAPEGGGPLTATSGSHYDPTSSEPEVYSTFPVSSRMRHSSPRGTGFEPGASRVQELHTKENEALRQRRGLVLASTPEGEDVVVQHMDGGQVPEAVPPPRAREIPPSYDSIPNR